MDNTPHIHINPHEDKPVLAYQEHDNHSSTFAGIQRADGSVGTRNYIGILSSVLKVGAEIYEQIIETASGKPTKSEIHGIGDLEFVPWQIGAVL